VARVRGAEMRPALSVEVVAILLRGWSAQAPVRDDYTGFSGGFVDLYDADGPAQLWRQHERFLRATAKAWGWEAQDELPDGRRVFAAELCAIEGIRC
jgi:hypothetical protein